MLTSLKTMGPRSLDWFFGNPVKDSDAATVTLSNSIQNVLASYHGIAQMLPEVKTIAQGLAHFFDGMPDRAFQNAHDACQKHLHRLMSDALDSHNGDLESNPEVRLVIRTMFQLSILRGISSAA